MSVPLRSSAFVRFLAFLLLAVLAACALHHQASPNGLHLATKAASTLGEWSADMSVSNALWTPGAPLKIHVSLRVPESLVNSLGDNGALPENLVMLVTAERTFDADGILRLPSDERMSTLLTPTGLPIEGGVQGAVTQRFGYAFRTPVDELASARLDGAARPGQTERQVTFDVSTKLPENLPPGIYRLRFDFGAEIKKRLVSLNGTPFARRGFLKEPCASEFYSQPIPASASRADGRRVDAKSIRPRLPWVLLENYNSNGYRGVVAEEDKTSFALSSRNIIQDDVILPLYDENNPSNKASYNLEPHFPTDTISDVQNIPLDYAKGELAIQVIGPDRKVEDLGRSAFVGNNGRWPTTRNPKFTRWTPWAYGLYTVKAVGWTQDIWGNRYAGGGTYTFWIAKRMTLATATFQGQSYPVGNHYGRDMAFSPAVPADVKVSATLFVNSDRNNARTVSCSGKATAGGTFGPAQGLKSLPFDAPGEYLATVLATYTDADGHLWVSSMRHAGIVYPPDTPILARGKKIKTAAGLVERGESHFEGFQADPGDNKHLDHVNFPYLSGDVLLIASEGEGANKIVPVLTWERTGDPKPYDPKLQGIGLTNVQIATSNGYSPHLFPEYVTDWEYFYASAPRPGLMGRFLVSENGSRSPYWPTSRHNFGGQIDATPNGDMPGDIYRLLGGVVIRPSGHTPMYAGYMANAFILPKGSNDNRVIAPGSEDLLGPGRQKAHFFLATNARPGMIYETGTNFVPAVQIDPVAPVRVTFSLMCPDGRTLVAQGVGDEGGSFVGRDRWALDQPGVYRYTLEGEWQGNKAVMPGLPKEGGEFYVVEKSHADGFSPLRMNLPPISKFDPDKGIAIIGSTTAKSVHYSMIMPGAVLAQGVLPVEQGRFHFVFDPTVINAATPTYSIANHQTGKPELGNVVHLTFFAQETSPVAGYSFARLIIRGNTVHYTR